jgi:hypothetical protein
LGIEKFGAAILEPFDARKRLAFWAMSIRAGVIRVALMAAAVALFELTAENADTADLDCSHHAALRDRQRRAVLLTIVSTVAVKDIRARIRHQCPPPKSRVTGASDTGIISSDNCGQASL